MRHVIDIKEKDTITHNSRWH